MFGASFDQLVGDTNIGTAASFRASYLLILASAPVGAVSHNQSNKFTEPSIKTRPT
jgi:hypothetical protein